MCPYQLELALLVPEATQRRGRADSNASEVGLGSSDALIINLQTGVFSIVLVAAIWKRTFRRTKLVDSSEVLEGVRRPIDLGAVRPPFSRLCVSSLILAMTTSFVNWRILLS